MPEMVSSAPGATNAQLTSLAVRACPVPSRHALLVNSVWPGSACRVAFDQITYLPAAGTRTVATRTSVSAGRVTGPSFVSAYASLGPVSPLSPFGPGLPLVPFGPGSPFGPGIRADGASFARVTALLANFLVVTAPSRIAAVLTLPLGNAPTAAMPVPPSATRSAA